LQDGDYPIAEECEDLSITLPIYPNMSNREMDAVIKSIILE
jgi:dTDP-4-amino-4,6-dideoxygalactose transaminase